MSVFRSAIQGDDGEVDPGYLAMYVVMAVVAGAIPVMCIGTIAEMIFSAEHHFHGQDLGIGIGSVCTGLGVAVGAVGAFRLGDKPRVGVVQTSQSKESKTVTTADPTA